MTKKHEKLPSMQRLNQCGKQGCKNWFSFFPDLNKMFDTFINIVLLWLYQVHKGKILINIVPQFRKRLRVYKMPVVRVSLERIGLVPIINTTS